MILNKENDHEHFMRKALDMANTAHTKGEIPVGAIIVYKNQIIARSHNQTEILNDFTAHAEMIAFTSASEHFGNKYLDQCTLYVTLEPCIMCAGAGFWTKIGKVVYGASDPKRGYSIVGNRIFNKKQEIIGGILEEECLDVLQRFFKEKRE